MNKNFKPKRKWGQNFLVDDEVLWKINQSINPRENDVILEVGGGKGELTELLLKSGAEIYTVEIDSALYERLQKRFRSEDNFKIYNSDILEFDFVNLGKNESKIRVAGNIPYNITSPLLEKLFKNAALIDDIFLLIQKEVAERICSGPGNKTYGILSVITRLYGVPEKLFDVSKNAFKPRPKVTSSLIKISIENQYNLKENDKRNVKQVVRTAFNQRRKMLRNSIDNLLPEDREDCPIELTKRAEKLGIEEYLELTEYIEEKTENFS